MIDIHAHIIPGADDGSFSLEESLEILEISEKDGIKSIVATPHLFSNAAKLKDLETLYEKFQHLNREKEKRHLDIELLPGAEIFFVSDLSEKLKTFGRQITLNQSDYFLLEFPMDIVFPQSKEYLHDIIADGFIPIIAHPERNRVFQEDPIQLYRILSTGALAQLDAGSFRGDFGGTPYYFARDLVKYNMAHVIASDCHHPKQRPPGLSFLYEQLSFLDKEHIDLLVEKNPCSILTNNVLPDMGPMKEPGKKTSVFEFIKRVLK